jgi:hypothetical protein
MKRRKITIELVKEEFEKEGYTVLSNKYKNNKNPLEYICPKGHYGKIRYDSWLFGQRCGQCSNNKRLDISFIRNQFLKEGYILISTTYQNTLQKLEYICPKEHKNSMSYANWYSGYRCPHCSGNARKDINEIKNIMELEGYKLLTNTYFNCYQKLELVCPNNHKLKLRWNDFQQGHRCKKCFFESRLRYNFYDIFEYYKYRKIVDRISNKIYKIYKYIINPLNLPRGRYQYHLDHIYTVLDGFLNGISPEVIANPFNLQMLIEHDNLSKLGTSEITLDELYLGYREYLAL